MGGCSRTTIDGHDVQYGDFVNVEVDGRWILCTFVEVSDDGDSWFRCVCEGDCVRGDDAFSDRFAEVGAVKFAYHQNDSLPHIGAGI